MIFTDYVNAGVAAFFLGSVVVILVASVYEWSQVISGRKPAVSSEVPFERRVA
jgi:carbon starvation protein